jgi:hypothetical protein
MMRAVIVLWPFPRPFVHLQCLCSLATIKCCLSRQVVPWPQPLGKWRCLAVACCAAILAGLGLSQPGGFLQTNRIHAS